MEQKTTAEIKQGLLDFGEKLYDAESLLMRLRTFIPQMQVDVGLLAQRKFREGWDAAVAKLSEQPQAGEVELQPTGNVTKQDAND